MIVLEWISFATSYNDGDWRLFVWGTLTNVLIFSVSVARTPLTLLPTSGSASSTSETAIISPTTGSLLSSSPTGLSTIVCST